MFSSNSASEQMIQAIPLSKAFICVAFNGAVDQSFGVCSYFVKCTHFRLILCHIKFKLFTDGRKKTKASLLDQADKAKQQNSSS